MAPAMVGLQAMASIVTTGVRAVPKRLLELGYRFKRPDLDAALEASL